MDEHPIQGLMTSTMENLKDMIDVNTIIGDPVETQDGTVIIPVSKLGFGFAAGGSEFNSQSDQGDQATSLPFGGGSGGGVSVTPIAFLIVNADGVKIMYLDEQVHIYEKMLDFAPQAIEIIEQMLKESGTRNGVQRRSRKKEEGKNDRNGRSENTNYMI